MTEKQIQETVRMRGSGVKYRQIAEVLGLSINTVKSHCKRHNVKRGTLNTDISNTCRNCGTVIEQIAKHKKRIFCCDECRQLWWNAHPEAVNRKANYHLTCAACGKEFISYGNKSKKYCSHHCYINARFYINEGKEEIVCER